MTDTATPAPERKRTSAWLLVAAGVAVVIVAVLVWLLLLRDAAPSEGPLSAPGIESIAISQHAGDQFGYGFGVAHNRGDEPATLKRIRAR